MYINVQCACRGSRRQQWQRRWREVDWVVAVWCETDLSVLMLNNTSINKLITFRFNSCKKVIGSSLDPLSIIRGPMSPRVPPRCTSVDFPIICYQQHIIYPRFVLMRFLISNSVICFGAMQEKNAYIQAHWMIEEFGIRKGPISPSVPRGCTSMYFPIIWYQQHISICHVYFI